MHAVSERGAGVVTTTRAASPQKRYPTPVILSPKTGAAVQGVVPIRIKATHIAGGSPITGMELDAPDGGIGFFYDGSARTVKWDTSGETLGPNTITLTATDLKGRMRSTSIVVDLTATSGPALTVTTPSNGDSVQGTVEIAGTVAPNATSGRAVKTIDVEIDGAGIQQLKNPGPSWSVNWSTDTGTVGKHVITVLATDAANKATSVAATVTVTPSEAITLTAPTSGATVHGLVHFTGSVSNFSDTAGLFVDVSDKGGEQFAYQTLDTAPGKGDTFDVPVDFDGYAGTFKLEVEVSDSDGQEVSVPLTVVVTTVKSTITLTAPAASVTTISGTTTFTATVRNNSGADDPAIETDIDGNGFDYEYVTAPAGGSGTYSVDVDTTQLSNGKHTFTFTLTDGSNDPVVLSRTLTVSN